MEKKARKYRLDESILWSALLYSLVGLLIGARLYHVITDIEVYKDAWWMALQIWQGGLSIIGAIIGAILTSFLYFRCRAGSPHKKVFTWFMFLDLAAFGLPFAQALGRVGNFLNQELYGLPTELPWGIFIDLPHRLAGFENFSRFHPLFAYELLSLLGIGSLLWWLEKKQTWRVGEGTYFAAYLMLYSGLRFLLDFLRIDGKNQVFLAILFVVTSTWFLQKQRLKKHEEI